MNPIIKFSTLFGLLAHRNRDRDGSTREGRQGHELRSYIAIPVFHCGAYLCLAFLLLDEIPMEDAK